jgi:acyl dehydratase
MAGKYFCEFEVGQTFVHEIRRTLTDMDNILFSALTYNPASIHIDHEYAKTTEFGKPLINSIFTLGLIVGLSVQDTTLGTTVGNLGWEEVAFPKPVFAGDTIRAETKVLALAREQVAADPRHRDVRASRFQPTRRSHRHLPSRRFDVEAADLRPRPLWSGRYPKQIAEVSRAWAA